MADAKEMTKLTLQEAERQLELEPPGQRRASLERLIESARVLEKIAKGGPVPAYTSRQRPFGRYQLERRIAIGATCEVWRTAGHPLFAVKLVLPNLADDAAFVERFLEAGRAAARLDHPNIAVTVEALSHDHFHGVVSELVEGSTLAAILRARKGGLPVPAAAWLMEQICAALHGAHRCPEPVVHLNLTARKCLVQPDGAVKVFGFASPRLAPADMPPTLPTPVYPEEGGGAPLDSRADVLACGALLYELLTGTTWPWGQQTPALEADGRLPFGLGALIARAVAARPRERFQACDELSRAVVAGLAAMGVAPARTTLAELGGSAGEKA